MKVFVTAAVAAFAGIFAIDPAMATPSVCDGTPGNSAQNCGFESGDLSDWSRHVNGSAAAIATMDQANSGLWSAELSAVGVTIGRPATSQASIDQSFATIVGQSYSIVFYVMGSTVGNGNFSFDATDSSANSVASLTLGGTPGWTKETFDFTATDTSLDLLFQVDATGNGNDADFFVDDVELDQQQVPEPNSLILLASGLLAAAASFGLMKRTSAWRS